MSFKGQFLMRLLPLAIFTLEGCSPQAQPPVNLARRITGADTAVLWDWAYMDHASFTGEEATRLVQAVSSAKGGSTRYRAQYGRTVEFYKGTNLLAAVRSQANLFKTSEGEYVDKSGVLGALNRGFPDESARKKGVTKLAADVVVKPELRVLRAWSEGVIWSYKTGGSRTNFYRNSTELIREAVPDWLKVAWPRQPTAIYLSEPLAGEADCLFLEWPGSCGLAVGPTNFVPAAAWGLKYLTNIMPGVYAYHN